MQNNFFNTSSFLFVINRIKQFKKKQIKMQKKNINQTGNKNSKSKCFKHTLEFPKKAHKSIIVA